MLLILNLIEKIILKIQRYLVKVLILSDDEPVKESSVTVKSSLMSLSTVTFFYWFHINLLAVVLFSTYFNSWISRISTSVDEGKNSKKLPISILFYTN